MNSESNKIPNQIIHDQMQERVIEYNGEVWYRTLLIKNKFEIIQNQNEIKYITDDGIILRIEEIKDQSKTIEIMKNFEQIQHLKWYGAYGKNFQKIGKWKVYWKGQILQDIGGEYSDDGKRQGQWKELIKNYWSKAQVYEFGKYENDERKGYWKYIYGNNEIDGGYYNEQGYKNGKWIDLGENFWDWSQVTYHGDYQDNKRIGNWDIKLRGELIGGGSYDNQGLKNGKWIELSDKFYDYGQVIQIGEYNKGQKIGRWNINYNNQQIGGGIYDEQGFKNGEWIDTSDNYYGWGQITYQGVYKNGQKIGLWVINFRDSSENPFVSIGGGQFDELGMKNGIWIDISESFDCDNQVTYVGEYNFGKKQGEWEIYYKKNYGNRSKERIGGGLFDEFGLKEGKWMDLNNKFYCLSQIIYNGQYKKGKKVGNWDIYYRIQGRENFEKMHDGLYNNQNLKQGYWIEESDIFNDDNQVKYKGEYQNGKRIGRWDIIYDDELIGGGIFDELSLKTGEWIELSDDFTNKEQTILQGDYIQGKKIGKWIRMCRKWIYGLDEMEREFSLIGENQYD